MTAVQRWELDDAAGIPDLLTAVRSATSPQDLAPAVAETIARVRADGDAALVEDARRFGAPEFTLRQVVVTEAECDAAARAMPADLRDAILTAAEQIRALADATLPTDRRVVLPAGQVVTVRSVPVGAAGCYVPGGRAAYPSSLLMSVIPAQVAGVGRVAVVSPPGADGRPHPVIMATASLLGVREVHAAGGAAAIAALAVGTESIAPVDVITGPGNSWVQEAKRQVTGMVGIDGFAGPSEVLVIADHTADPRAVALDLLAQAEHGEDSCAVCVATDSEVLDAVAEAVAAEGDPIGRVTLARVGGTDLAVAFAEAMAAEHLEVITADAGEIASRITRSGAVFVGRHGATAFGDYVAGSNHVLPTGGAATFASALGTSTYLRRMSVVEMTDQAVQTLTGHLATIAAAEGFEMHARSALARLETIEDADG